MILFKSLILMQPSHCALINHLDATLDPDFLRVAPSQRLNNLIHWLAFARLVQPRFNKGDNPGILHRITFCFYEEGGSRIADQVLIQIERLIHVIVRRRWKTCLHRCREKRNAELCSFLERDWPVNDHPKL